MLRLPAKASAVTVDDTRKLPANPQLLLAIRVRTEIVTDGSIRYPLNHPRPEQWRRDPEAEVIPLQLLFEVLLLYATWGSIPRDITSPADHIQGMDFTVVLKPHLPNRSRQRNEGWHFILCAEGRRQ